MLWWMSCGFWLVLAMIRMMVLDGSGIGDEFQWRSNKGPMRLAGGKG